MPVRQTLKTKIFLATMAFDFFSIFLSFNYYWTIWIRAKSLVCTYQHFMVLLKFFEFIISSLVNNLFKELIRNLFLASLLWTYKFVPFSWLFNLVFKEFLVRPLAKRMTTLFHGYEFIHRMVFVTYLTKLCFLHFFFLYYVSVFY